MLKLNNCYQCGSKAKKVGSTVECTNQLCGVCVTAKNGIKAVKIWNTFS